MIEDARAVPDASALEADLCVIGGGAAGITIAREFAGSPVKVVLLESGGLELDGETQGLNKGANVGLPYFPLDGARLRAFGGTTHHWGGVCRPFDPIDFERRPGVPHTGWPIDRATLDRYYPEARSIVGLESSSWDVEDWDRRDRFEPIELSSRRVHTRIAQTVKKQDRSFGERYRDDVRRAKNVTAYLFANVTEIETDRSGAAAVRVAVRTLAGTGFSVSARSFVLAVGGIENARLLLVSRSRHERGLGNQNDLVGRFFLEHPDSTARPSSSPGGGSRRASTSRTRSTGRRSRATSPPRRRRSAPNPSPTSRSRSGPSTRSVPERPGFRRRRRRPRPAQGRGAREAHR